MNSLPANFSSSGKKKKKVRSKHCILS
jgi:hypothetical protein